MKKALLLRRIEHLIAFPPSFTAYHWALGNAFSKLLKCKQGSF